MNEWLPVVLIIVLAAVLIWAWRKGYISHSDVSGITDAIEQISPMISEGSLFDKIANYALYAFRAAEQMMKKGEIKAEERKTKALELVKTYADTDEVELTAQAMQTADALIEANCDIKGHSSD